jgi:hypothetical protein
MGCSWSSPPPPPLVYSSKEYRSHCRNNNIEPRPNLGQPAWSSQYRRISSETLTLIRTNESQLRSVQHRVNSNHNTARRQYGYHMPLVIRVRFKSQNRELGAIRTQLASIRESVIALDARARRNGVSPHHPVEWRNWIEYVRAQQGRVRILQARLNRI